MTSPSDPTILQFGSGRFLRSFVDLFCDELNRAARTVEKVAVLQSTSTGRADALRRQGFHYHVAVRGILGGQLVDRVEEVHSVVAAVAMAERWDEAKKIACSPGLKAIVSNTTEAGVALDPAEPSWLEGPPRSFPARLLGLLETRRRYELPGLAILPCELLDRNAAALKNLVLEQARRWKRPREVTDWLCDACTWHNTLVDRIVSLPRSSDPLVQADPLFSLAEPYAFWGIEHPPADWPVSKHEAVEAVDDLGPYQLRKIRILNAAHTALAARALPLGVETVRQAMGDRAIRAWLETLLFEEIVPVLEGRCDRPAEFARAVLERFENPFFDHRLVDIALHHATKLQTRLAPTQVEFLDRFHRAPRLLAEILEAKGA